MGLFIGQWRNGWWREISSCLDPLSPPPLLPPPPALLRSVHQTQAESHFLLRVVMGHNATVHSSLWCGTTMWRSHDSQSVIWCNSDQRLLWKLHQAAALMSNKYVRLQTSDKFDLHWSNFIQPFLYFGLEMACRIDLSCGQVTTWEPPPYFSSPQIKDVDVDYIQFRNSWGGKSHHLQQGWIKTVPRG